MSWQPFSSTLTWREYSFYVLFTTATYLITNWLKHLLVGSTAMGSTICFVYLHIIIMSIALRLAHYLYVQGQQKALNGEGQCCIFTPLETCEFLLYYITLFASCSFLAWWL